MSDLSAENFLDSMQELRDILKKADLEFELIKDKCEEIVLHSPIEDLTRSKALRFLRDLRHPRPRIDPVVDQMIYGPARLAPCVEIEFNARFDLTKSTTWDSRNYKDAVTLRVTDLNSLIFFAIENITECGMAATDRLVSFKKSF